MIPVSPVIPGLEHLEVQVAKDQLEYQTLPALPIPNESGDFKHALLTRWEPTAEELQTLLEGGSIFISRLVFGQPLQPLFVTVGKIGCVEHGNLAQDSIDTLANLGIGVKGES